MLFDEDIFDVPNRNELRESLPPWENETEADYKQRLKDIQDINLLDYKSQNARRETRRPFYPLLKHLEAHISEEFRATCKLINTLGLIIIVLLTVIAIGIFRH